MNLFTLGWNKQFEEAFLPYDNSEYTVGRVALEHKRMYRIFTEQGELLGEVSGKFRYNTQAREDFPAVGDWVVITTQPNEDRALIHAVLPRQSKFSRKSAGEVTEEQIVASNVNSIFLVAALNQDFNLRRLERYILLTWESGANPVIVLSKSDLCIDIEEKVAKVEAIAFGVPIHVISAKEDTGIQSLQQYLTDGQTVALLGSSGAGKSTLSNKLYGKDVQAVQQVREGDDRGRHTTTHRELIVLTTGGIIIDTPGMRELQLWDSEDSVAQSFQDIEVLSEQCRFTNCKHQSEPGCAVLSAIDQGVLEQSRFLSFVKITKELAYLERKADNKARIAERKKWKKISGDRTRFHRK
ncbi:ribosome small subunit-dependent GTPase A [Cytobacillus sp. IB215316]|uniref:ribosome small subunit-dependent GTPase A n=1 Tax=Cytobacillus sp. IB215316 TaxID=3097354 RepID=UPI002A15CA6B|nr:ribosome small subunit-dependent GTPase A [Cytobacillus sp. IB215316]MDX8360507.1 ribosome small subunit-dependent GTPase A [Cytobacillus sp. IB215316]